MNEQAIDYWLRRWDAEGLITVDFCQEDYHEIVSGLAKMKFSNPFVLYMCIMNVINS